MKLILTMKWILKRVDALIKGIKVFKKKID